MRFEELVELTLLGLESLTLGGLAGSLFRLLGALAFPSCSLSRLLVDPSLLGLDDFELFEPLANRAKLILFALTALGDDDTGTGV